MSALAPRGDFPLLAAQPTLCYLDSAATAQKPRAVLDAERAFYETANANPHRGAYAPSAAATDAYAHARRRIARFLGVADADTMLFTRGTTEAMNLLVTGWGRTHVRAGDRIVVTRLEHHANFVPWQQLALAVGAEFAIAELTATQEIDLDDLRAKVTPNTKVIAFGHVSNAVGTINPVAELVAIAHGVGALAVCDGAQGAPHLAVSVDALGVDAYAFSGHKLLGPMGIGGIVVRRSVLERMAPYQFGGDMIEFVGDQATTWHALPHRFEAGTPNAAGAVGLAAACDYLDALGMAQVRVHERALIEAADAALHAVGGVRILGPSESARRSGVVSFMIDGVHPHDAATLLDGAGVCVRAGHHCAQPLMRSLGVAATVRASFYVYSTAEDVARLVAAVRSAQERFAID
ncbi:MAG: SufS family cysteine desulfurase [Gemmatimonadaceae bacterium]|nr:SufS family cysteine desulfurase [Gemmatimonadaceae bacterium]